MTNYQWLVKGNKLGEFIYDCHYYDWDYVCAKYKIDNTALSISITIAKWFNEERKVTKWVKLEDVIDVLGIPVRYNEQATFTPTELIRTVNENIQVILDNVNNLETREIEDEV